MMSKTSAPTNDNTPSENYSYKIINDPIYGCIGLSKFEVQLLDTQAMQRLRHIQQMGFASYVFPSGEHSRFVHSLGVLCIMGKMCTHLLRQSKSTKKFTLKDVKILRVAALLHDIGHFPFSHLTETVYSFIDNIKNTQDIISSDEQTDTTTDIIGDIANHKMADSYHERLGAEVIAKDPEISRILKDNDIDPVTVGLIITGEHPSFYSQLLHSSIDADRLDYLMRDSRQAGVIFGTIELDYILQQIRLIDCPSKNNSTEISATTNNYVNTDTDTLIVAYNAKGKHAIEHFLMARYFHYIQVIQHKTISAFEAVAKVLLYKLFTSLKENYDKYLSIKNIIGTEKFYRFTDDFVWQSLSDYCNQHSTDEYISALWHCLSRREKPTIALTLTDILPKQNNNIAERIAHGSIYHIASWLIANHKEELVTKVGIASEYVGYAESKVSLSSLPLQLKADDFKGNFTEEVRDAIWIIDKNDKKSILALDDKSLINKMVNYTSNTLNVFIIGKKYANKAEDLHSLILKEASK